MKVSERQLLTMALCAAASSSGSLAAQTIVGSTCVYQIGEVVVTGCNHATDRNLLPYAVSAVADAQLEATGQSQLLSALSGRVPSMFVAERNIIGFGAGSGGSGGMKIRGVGGSPTSGVLMMVDGQPQFAGISHTMCYRRQRTGLLQLRQPPH